MNSQLQELIAKILLVDPNTVTPETRQEEIEDWDSMTHLVLISDIEQEFDVKFTDDEVTEIESVDDIIELLEQKGISD